MNRLIVRGAWIAAAVVLVAGCTSLPAGAPGLAGAATPAPAASANTAPTDTPVATSAPAATAAPGSTEAAGSGALPATELSAAASQATSTAPVEATTAPTPGGPATTAPEPTLPPAPTAAPEAAATPAPAAPQAECTPGQLTPSQTEGPYYKANPPAASDLLQPGMGGTKLTIEGFVLDAQCQPVPGARVDFWQADSEGQYDNQGYTLRGYQVTDATGRYQVETVVPGLYPGRTRHIHVKVSAPNGPVLTTQLYFPGEPANQSDQIFSPALVMNVSQAADGDAGTFNFVINTR